MVNEREQYRGKVLRIQLMMALLAFGFASFAFFTLIVGSVASGAVLVITATYLALSVVVALVGLKHGRQWGVNADPGTGTKSLGKLFDSPWGVIAAVLAPSVGLAVAAEAGPAGQCVLPLAVSALCWFMVGV